MNLNLTEELGISRNCCIFALFKSGESIRRIEIDNTETQLLTALQLKADADISELIRVTYADKNEKLLTWIFTDDDAEEREDYDNLMKLFAARRDARLVADFCQNVLDTVEMSTETEQDWMKVDANLNLAIGTMGSYRCIYSNVNIDWLRQIRSAYENIMIAGQEDYADDYNQSIDYNRRLLEKIMTDYNYEFK